MLEKYKPVANLTTVKSNPAASAANIRQPKLMRRPVPLNPPTAANLANGSDSVFEAMMAVNQSQNKIFDQVLDGPVSQQTQRQLAQIQAQNLKNTLVEDIKENQEKPPAQAKARREAEARTLSQGQISNQNITTVSQNLVAQNTAGQTVAGQTAGQTTAGEIASQTVAGQNNELSNQNEMAATEKKRARTMGLTAGHTIRSGIDTGKIFSPSQLTAFRQRLGLGNLSATQQAAQALVSGAQLINKEQTPSADEISKLIRGSQAEKQSSAATVSESKILTSELDDGISQISQSITNNIETNGADTDIDEIVKRVGEALGMDPSLIKAVIKTESNFNHKAVSAAGAKGLMQLMPGTAKEMGVKDPFNPLENIWGGARYLKRMLDNYGGNLNKALAAYNWGPGNVNRYGTASKSMPRETRRYIEVVNSNYNRFKNSTVSA
jgi:soluble lytic murein transglycosylase-like protein